MRAPQLLRMRVMEKDRPQCDRGAPVPTTGHNSRGLLIFVLPPARGTYVQAINKSWDVLDEREGDVSPLDAGVIFKQEQRGGRPRGSQ